MEAKGTVVCRGIEFSEFMLEWVPNRNIEEVRGEGYKVEMYMGPDFPRI